MSTIDEYTRSDRKEDQFTVLYGKRAILINSPARATDGRPSESSHAQAKRYLIVSDLHIGFEDKFRGEGVSIEPRIDKMQSELIDIIQKNHVSDLVVNGDVKAGIDRITKSEWELVPKFIDKMKSLCTVTIVPGNHDGGLRHLLPDDVEITDPSGTMIGENLIFHGQTRPPLKFSNVCKRMILGHVHPIFQLRGSPLSGQPVWVFLRADPKSLFEKSLVDENGPGHSKNLDQASDSEKQHKKIEVIIIPSFNMDLVQAGYAASAAKQERRIAPILRDLKLVDDALIVTLGGDLIGDASLIPKVL